MQVLSLFKIFFTFVGKKIRKRQVACMADISRSTPEKFVHTGRVGIPWWIINYKNKHMHRFIFISLFCATALMLKAQIAEKDVYLNGTKVELMKKWPENKTVNLVFHGHSVPSGYFRTPDVKTLQAYPHLTLEAIKSACPYAVVNVIVTAIGGENAERGATRLDEEVLPHRPDVLFIDYALNDRGIGLERAGKAWSEMIEKAQKQGVKVILLTPTPDTGENITDDASPLEQHSRQIRALAAKYKTGLVDAYSAFKEKSKNGEDVHTYMSQGNHPNEKGHRVVSELIMEYFAGSENR
jgi:lysophospholipase L1-like esterase